MKTLKLKKDKFRVGKAGDTITVRTEEQAKLYTESGDAEEVEAQPEPKKELVLRNPAPGTYTTEWVTKKQDKATAKEEKAQADSDETVSVPVADQATGKTVKEKVSTGKKK